MLVRDRWSYTMMSKIEHPPAVEFVAINKQFGAVHANADVMLKIQTGSIHGIVGENGAGKSTLMNILYGFYEADSGEILINGAKAKIKTSEEAIALGIGMVHQHFMLVDDFTVMENILLGHEGGWLLEKGKLAATLKLEEINNTFNLSVDFASLTSELSVGQQQRVEIIKALYRGADVLILDEPTAVLTPNEAEQLFSILDVLKKQGKTIILITHKLKEIMSITDAVTVMRAGRVIDTLDTKKTDTENLAELMVGRKIASRKSEATSKSRGEKVLIVKNLCVRDGRRVNLLKDINLEIAKGEIVGIAGVSGNGQSELLQVLSGLRKPTSGEVWLNRNEIAHMLGKEGCASAMRKMGVAHVPEDRLRDGLVKTFSVHENAVLGYHNDTELNCGWFSGYMPIENSIKRAEAFIKQFDIRPAAADIKTNLLSGGNQQKLVLAREIESQPDLLLIGQPTRGVDIGAIEFIHEQIRILKSSGKAILLVSVELDEILALSDRILVMCAGEIVGATERKDADEQKIGLWMAGISS